MRPIVIVPIEPASNITLEIKHRIPLIKIGAFILKGPV
jgi:hypothetical protein